MSFAITLLVATAAAKQLSLLSWNILAPCYCPAGKYPSASADVLAWPRRQEGIVRRLAELDADVVCLQEVGVAEWDVLSQRLGDIGYDVLLQQMSNDHPVANAVLLRKGHVELVRS